MSGFGFPSLKHPQFGFIMAHEGIETNSWGLEFGAEAKDSREVKIISISCDRRWRLLVGRLQQHPRNASATAREREPAKAG